LDRLITFSSTQRYRRVRVLADRVDEAAMRREIDRWTAWQRSQLDAMVGYVRGSGCRREAILRYFGHAGAACGFGQERCDSCGGVSPWQRLGPDTVPDPEYLVDVDLVVLQAVAWSGSWSAGRYSEQGLKAALIGAEALDGGRRLSAGLLRCPQFGALRYVRAADRRWEDAVGRLVDAGMMRRDQVRRDATTYPSLALTDRGRSTLGGRGG
jgi:ATP-dependent DNA helicase RecQ